MKKRISAWSSKLAALFMGLFGFVSCGSVENIPPQIGGGEVFCMYGVPMAAYYIEGVVTDAQTKEQLDDIEVTFVEGYKCDTTENGGAYVIDCPNAWPQDNIHIKVRDVAQDRELYPTKEIEVTDYQFKDGTNVWDRGKATIKLNIELTKQEDDEK